MQDKQKQDAASAVPHKASKVSAGELRLQKGEACLWIAHPRPLEPVLWSQRHPYECDHSSQLVATLLADMSELNLPSNITIAFPEGKEKIMHFQITIRPDEGHYR